MAIAGKKDWGRTSTDVFLARRKQEKEGEEGEEDDDDEEQEGARMEVTFSCGKEANHVIRMFPLLNLHTYHRNICRFTKCRPLLNA